MQSLFNRRLMGLLVSVILTFCPPVTFPKALAQDTRFTYQGRLDVEGAPYAGNAEFLPTLWDAPHDGSKVADNAPPTLVIGVSNGLFTLPLDFGASFPGAARWLQLEVRTVLGPFTLLIPRQPLTPTPYAITAGSLAGTLPATRLGGPVPSANLAGTYSGVLTFDNPANQFTGSGAGLTALNASQLTSGTVTDARLAANLARTNQVWLLGGNAGTTPGTHFIGTRDNQPLELRANNLRGFRLEPTASNTVNIVAGWSGNHVATGVIGAVVAGGGAPLYWDRAQTNAVTADFGVVGGGAMNTAGHMSVVAGGHWNTVSGGVSAVGGGAGNQVFDSFAVISGGYLNLAKGMYSTLGGGRENRVEGEVATVGGGYYNRALAEGVTVCGGNANTASGWRGSIGGGSGNAVVGSYGTVPGGHYNFATNFAFAAGYRAKANHDGAFVWADATNADFASTAPNQFLIRASGGVGIGGAPTNALLDVKGDVRLNDNDLRLRGGTDVFQGLGWYGSGKPFAGLTPDGPALYGWAGGVLGTHRGGARAVLQWRDGKVGVGRTPAANALEVEGNASKTAAGSWLANSDARIKQDIATVTNAIETLSRVRLVSFRYTDAYRAAHPGIEDRRYLNVVAQEFAEVFPDYVQPGGEKLPDGSDILQVDAHPLTIYTAAAVQELSRRLDEERAANAALRDRVARLEQLIEQLLK